MKAEDLLQVLSLALGVQEVELPEQPLLQRLAAPLTFLVEFMDSRIMLRQPRLQFSYLLLVKLLGPLDISLLPLALADKFQINILFFPFNF